KIAAARDRALFTALLNEGSRWWLRFDPALDDLLKQPLRERQPEVHALLVLGLVQREVMGIAEYAVVASSVEAVRALQRPRFAGLVNAVLRRWLRERSERLQSLDAVSPTQHAFPSWLIDAVGRDWPDLSAAVLAASNRLAPLMLRVNRRRQTREGLQARLAQTGVASGPHPWLADALILDRNRDITALPGFVEGHFSVQDGAAQIAVDLLSCASGMRVLDACAAPGGKSCHLLERNDLHLLAVEREVSRAERIRENQHRLGLPAVVCLGDATAPASWWDGEAFDRILLDAPCSASGVIRRHPDIKLHRRERDLEALVAVQHKLLAALWPLLVPGGRLLYATCSILRAENQHVVQTFVDTHVDAVVEHFSLPAGRSAGPGWQLLPGEADLDGMYYARLSKRTD
ncbi:MAG TPA: 16S rRNA (cytosine(967)-C(5))-methyltransferase RsmB, partial [Mizugakiibacter sp.]|nr:16S rRNA (cytosine(967)-C(5))-methyltransferase RsmB [Mizugakiibacter sp.]